MLLICIHVKYGTDYFMKLWPACHFFSSIVPRGLFSLSKESFHVSVSLKKKMASKLSKQFWFVQRVPTANIIVSRTCSPNPVQWTRFYFHP